MLEALALFDSVVHEDFLIRSPKCNQLATLPNTLILEDLPNATDLGDYVRTNDASLDSGYLGSLGFALGVWLITFHEWANCPSSQAAKELQERIAGNMSMKELKTYINIGRVPKSIEGFPDIAWESKDIYEQIEKDVKRFTCDDGNQVIHGDFWRGK